MLNNLTFYVLQVVELIESGQAETALIEVTRVFEPIRSMLSQKFTSKSNKDFLQKEMFQETKMDGERFQLHMMNNEFRYYSRNGHEYSEGFNALLTPLIQFTPVIHKLILDGEMLVYDKIEKRYHTKGETKIDVKFMKDKSSNLQPCFCAFDVLLFNDQNMLKRPYIERHQLLDQLFENREGVFVKTKPIKIRDVDHVVDLFNIAINNGEEGIILKDAQSSYKPGERFGGWYKVKADYFDGELVKDFDCIVIGGFYENHHTQNFIQRYMLGAIEKQEDGSFDIFAIAEVVHGITVQERQNISNSLKQHLVHHKGESEISFGNGKILFGRNKPHFWIPPMKSIVLECRVAELEPTTSFKSEFTFRFPRIANVRRDKIWDESCTMQDFLEMCKGDSGRVQKTVIRPVHKDDLTRNLTSPTRKRKSKMSVANIISKLKLSTDNIDDVKAIDNALEGREYCVLTTSANLPSMKDMKLMVLQHSGTVTESPRKGKTFALIVGEITKMVKSYINEQVFNVIKAEWLVNNFGEGKVHMVPPKIRPVIDFIYTTAAMKNSLKKSYDEYGDSYTEPFENINQLKDFLDTMEPCDENIDLTELDEELGMLGMPNINFMRNVSAAFITANSENFMFDSAKLILQLRAGKVIDRKDIDQNHPTAVIIVDRMESKEGKEEWICKTKIPENLNAKIELVDFKWILESNDAGKLLDKSEYIVSET